MGMTMSNSQYPQTEIPESFIEQVKTALESLYDFPALHNSLLAQAFDDADPKSNYTHRLRRKLLEAIETLSPGHGYPGNSGVARIYNLVYLHYVGGQTLQEAALEVGVSLRQAYRDLRRGQESVSAILWYSREQDSSPKTLPKLTELSSINSEITRLDGDVTTVPIQKMLESALKAVERLAEQHQVRLNVQLPQTPVFITTNPVIAQQVLIHILSRVIQQITPCDLMVSLDEQRGVDIVLSYPRQTATPLEPIIEPIISQMIVQIHWKIQDRVLGSEQQFVIGTEQEGSLILIIDDNEGLVDLLAQYLNGNAYRVASAHNGEDGLRIAHELLPDAIMVDLMMPGMDGWEFLQRLRTDGNTEKIPVIICSVINDPELAYSLGASMFIAKPVSSDMLLNVLRELKL